MSKIKIKIIVLGHLPHLINLDRIVKWKSDLFEITEPVSTYDITNDSDLIDWGYSDRNIEEQLPKKGNEDILLAVTNVPIENRFFARRFSDNRVCLTYNTMTEILMFDNIPLENLMLRVLYSISFVFKLYGNRIPLITENTNFTHDETKGCVFDMNGIKTDIIYSLNVPQLCHACIHKLTSNPKYRIERSLVESVQHELKKIRKTRYYRIVDWIKRRPILTIIISSFGALILGTLGSLLASCIFEFLK